eukprot:5688372-Alexandrium_andersonii.AAC.1
MSASLVGSEMCIRDSQKSPWPCSIAVSSPRGWGRILPRRRGALHPRRPRAAPIAAAPESRTAGFPAALETAAG